MKRIKGRYSDRKVVEGEIDNREGIQLMHPIEELDTAMDQLDPDGILRERYGSHSLSWWDAANGQWEGR